MYMVRSVCCGALLIKYLFSRASGLLSVCATVVLERKSFAFIVLFIALSSQCFRSAINIDVCLQDSPPLGPPWGCCCLS
jgi:hypothetical protein